MIELALANKDVFTTLVTLFVFVIIFIPYIKSQQKAYLEMVEKLIGNLSDNQKQCSLTLKDEMGKFYKLLAQHTTEDNANFKAIANAISKAVGKTVLTNEQLLEVCKSKVWLASEKKLDYIKKRLEKNNLVAREEIIKRQIRTELLKLSNEEYIIFLNQFNSPVGFVGDWIATNFPFDDFLNEIYDILFRKDSDLTEREIISLKIEDCRGIMAAYQSELWEKLKIELK